MKPAAAAHDGVEIRPHDDHVEVRGVSSDDLHEALALLRGVRRMQAAHTAERRPAIIRALMTATQTVAVPPASLAQAQRAALGRDSLIASGVETYESLAALRHDNLTSSTRTWVSRRRAAYDLFVVTHAGRTLVPRFLLSASGAPRPELRELLRVLAAADTDPWAQWHWLTTPSNLLSGGVPKAVAQEDPGRAARAARRFVASRQS